MKNIILTLILTVVLVMPVNALTSAENGKILAGSLLTEHLKRKDCDPLVSFVLTTGINALVDLYNNEFKAEKIGFVWCGVALSYSVEELGDMFFAFLNEGHSDGK